jgi:hypothetical protein
MFSRSFIKSPSDTSRNIAARAHVSRESVRRSAACSGEHNYTYSHTGFRAFQDAADGNYAQNLINDYQEVYEKGNPTLPYHAALTALHHKTASTAITTFLAQPKTTLQLVQMHNTRAPAPIPVELDYARSQHLLDKMQFALPRHHPKRLVIFRGRGLGPINFDPTQLPPERRFVKTCCPQMSSADTCCCHVGSSNESLRYVNACGESMHVCYYERKNDYFNIAYRMWGDDTDQEKDVPHSPKSEVSDSEVFPTMIDNFENEIANAFEANRSGFKYIWKNKNLQRRFEIRQRRRHEKLASGELPKYGLIVINVETNEIRAAKPHPIPGEDEDMCRRNKTRYGDIRAEVHAEAIKERTLAPPAVTSASAVASAPAPRFNTTGLLSFQIRRLIQQEYRDQSIRDIQRPLSDATITIAHGMSRAQVTEISALKTYQRTRLTAFASFAAFLAIRFSAECGYTASVATILHHRMIQFILRRATGSIACAQQISAPYIKCGSPIKSLPKDRIRELRAEAECRFDTDNPSGFPLAVHPLSSLPCSTRGGPIQYHTAKYYAQKCLELIGNPAADTAAAARWRELDTQVLRVRRGEIAAHEVFASPQHNNWIYMVHYTYIVACRQFLTAIECWKDVSDTAKSYAGPGNQCPTIWRDSHIHKDSPRYVQCAQIVHDMYRFIYRAARIISSQYMAVFGFNQRYMNAIVQRTRYLAHYDGDETSALMFGFLMPAMMTPDVHLDIFVEGHIFQHPVLYVKMSDPVFGPIKKQLRDVIPSRHTGTIDRTTLTNNPKIVRRA